MTWLFANLENLRSFESNPDQYVPAFGGFCAYGVSQGYKAPTQIQNFTIVDGKLYLNFSSYIRRFWLSHQKHLILEANRNWEQVKGEKPITVTFTQIWFKYQFYRLFKIPFFPKMED